MSFPLHEVPLHPLIHGSLIFLAVGYLDPGSGLLIIQMLVGFFASVFFTATKFWTQISAMVKKVLKRVFGDAKQ